MKRQPDGLPFLRFLFKSCKKEKELSAKSRNGLSARERHASAENRGHFRKCPLQKDNFSKRIKIAFQKRGKADEYFCEYSLAIYRAKP